MEMEADKNPACHLELGVKLGRGPSNKSKHKNKLYISKLKIFREFALATLSALVKTKARLVQVKHQHENLSESTSSEKCQRQVSALDALANTGVTGMQWKKHLGECVEVTLSDHEDLSLLTSNVEQNSLSASEFSLDGRRVPGDPRSRQGTNEVRVCQADAKAVMMMEAFQFIYINAWKNCVTYLESACHSVCHDGMLCLVVSDSSMFARSPHVVKRWYMADVIKTEYLKEMAARVVLADLAVSAGRFNKALVPQYVVTVEDFLLVCVKVTKGHTAAEESVNEVSKLIHCRFCEERVFLPQQLAPVEDPYSILPCQCKEKNPGKTAVLLGPMWKGPIYNLSFLTLMQNEGKSLGLSAKFSTLISLLLSEAVCAASSASSLGSHAKNNGGNGSVSRVQPPPGETGKATERSGSTSLDNKHVQGESDIGKTKDVMEGDTTNGTNSSNLSNTNTDNAGNPLKRKEAGDAQSECAAPPQKKQNLEGLGDISQQLPSSNVLFYQHVNKLKNVTLPKLDQFVSIIQRSGYRASRTHFDPCAIRTTANVNQFLNILLPKNSDQ